MDVWLKLIKCIFPFLELYFLSVLADFQLSLHIISCYYFFDKYEGCKAKFIVLFWSQDPYICFLGDLHPSVKFCLKIAKTENCQKWKLLGLQVAKIEGCQNCKLTRLQVAKIASCQNCQNCKLSKLKIAKLLNCQN